MFVCSGVKSADWLTSAMTSWRVTSSLLVVLVHIVAAAVGGVGDERQVEREFSSRIVVYFSLTV